LSRRGLNMASIYVPICEISAPRHSPELVHNPKVAGSNPAPAIGKPAGNGGFTRSLTRWSRIVRGAIGGHLLQEASGADPVSWACARLPTRGGAAAFAREEASAQRAAATAPARPLPTVISASVECATTRKQHSSTQRRPALDCDRRRSSARAVRHGGRRSGYALPISSGLAIFAPLRSRVERQAGFGRRSGGGGSPPSWSARSSRSSPRDERIPR
jgi:hypothetical protein